MVFGSLTTSHASPWHVDPAGPVNSRVARLYAVARRAKYGYVEADVGWRALADPAAMRQTAQGLRADLEPALSAIRVPTLLIRGADSRLVSPAAWAKTTALRPDLPAIEVADGDHYAPEEVHGPIADEIGRFWGSLNKGR